MKKSKNTISSWLKEYGDPKIAKLYEDTMEINKIYNENCLDTMARMQDNLIDLTVTSPPYDNLRTYNNDIDKSWNEDVWKSIINELYRVTKDGGVVVWIVGDATIKGSETGTSFKQALYGMECGFRLHDTMIYKKKRVVPLTHRRYEQSFEYMFVFVKGKLKTFNPVKVPCKYAGTETWGKPTFHKTNDSGLVAVDKKVINNFKQKENVWEYLNAKDKKTKHPAPFPEKLANDHIISWSNENDIVYDPFMGSGTTAKMAKLNNRNYIGSELSDEYCKIAEERVNKTDLFNESI